MWKMDYFLYIPMVLAYTFLILKMWKMWRSEENSGLFKVGFHIFEAVNCGNFMILPYFCQIETFMQHFVTYLSHSNYLFFLAIPTLAPGIHVH